MLTRSETGDKVFPHAPDPTDNAPLIDTISDTPDGQAVTAQQWFDRGRRVSFDPTSRRIHRPGTSAQADNAIKVFRIVQSLATDDNQFTWLTFLPGWPDGSYGWSKVDSHLGRAGNLPKLFVEYVGHGDSDKPRDYTYSTFERADLVEAHWLSEEIKSTFLICFDYSSIVALELLARQLDRDRQGLTPHTRIVGVLLANGGLFADAHSHPWFTTPVLNSAFGSPITALAQRSRLVFRELMKPLWSKDYALADDEIEQLFQTIGRRNGVLALSKSAGFVDEHKRNSHRWDLARIFQRAKSSVAFHVVGSRHDQFEYRQSLAARERLGRFGLDVRTLPGGHLTTSEHPGLLAEIIREVAEPQREERIEP